MSKPAFSVNDGVLQIAGRVIETDFPVAQAIEVGSKVIVRLEVPVKTVKNDNVLCYNRRGQLLWSIQKSPHGGVEDNPYMFIKAADGEVFAACWVGVDYQVNLRDGTVTVIGFSK